MSSSRKILVAIGLGILLGIFLGERASFLQYIADGYVRLLQMTVLPYVTISLIAGIGSLRLDQRTLGLKLACSRRVADRAGDGAAVHWRSLLCSGFVSAFAGGARTEF
jgi:hypothetical protein